MKNQDQKIIDAQRNLLESLCCAGAIEQAINSHYLGAYLGAWALMSVLMGSPKERDLYCKLADGESSDFYLPGESARSIDESIDKAILDFTKMEKKIA